MCYEMQYTLPMLIPQITFLNGLGSHHEDILHLYRAMISRQQKFGPYHAVELPESVLGIQRAGCRSMPECQEYITYAAVVNVQLSPFQ